MSVCPEGQRSMMEVPSSAGLVKPIMFTELELLIPSLNGWSHIPADTKMFLP